MKYDCDALLDQLCSLIQMIVWWGDSRWWGKAMLNCWYNTEEICWIVQIIELNDYDW